MELPILDLFTVPFLSGLVFAVLLPVLGCYLRLRDEWLAALAYAHVAAAGVLGSMALGLPLVVGGLLLAALAAVLKRFLAGRLAKGAIYPLLLIAGWSLSVLLTANLPMAERLGHALFDGQLYFTDTVQLLLAVIWLALALPFLRRLGQRLLLAHVYPDYFAARGLPAWPTELGFDLLTAASLALATMTMGVMGAFALLFIPPWVAFALGGSWRKALVLAVGLGVLGYVFSFALALALDQPFGPVLALGLILLGGGVFVRRPQLVIAPSRPAC